VTFAFDTGGSVNDVEGAIAFGDGIGGAFGQACAAGDAFFNDFHGHGFYLLKLILGILMYCGLKIPDWAK
jgi:hypothetical protein